MPRKLKAKNRSAPTAPPMYNRIIICVKSRREKKTDSKTGGSPIMIPIATTSSATTPMTNGPKKTDFQWLTTGLKRGDLNKSFRIYLSIRKDRVIRSEMVSAQG